MLINCPECNNEVSDKCGNCPHCGYPIEAQEILYEEEAMCDDIIIPDDINESEQAKENIPQCPICQSTDLSKISTVKKAAKIGMFGIFGAGDIGKTWKCNNCGSRF